MCTAVCEGLSASRALMSLSYAVLRYGVNETLSVQSMLGVVICHLEQARVPIGLRSCCVKSCADKLWRAGQVLGCSAHLRLHVGGCSAGVFLKDNGIEEVMTCLAPTDALCLA